MINRMHKLVAIRIGYLFLSYQHHQACADLAGCKYPKENLQLKSFAFSE